MDTIPAAAISASGSNYVRFSDGTQLCWGKVNQSSGVAITFSFPVAFKDTNYFAKTDFEGGAADSNLTNYKTTSVTNRTAIYGGSSAWRYFAIGRWK